jgi:hypothetical protein
MLVASVVATEIFSVVSEVATEFVLPVASVVTTEVRLTFFGS